MSGFQLMKTMWGVDPDELSEPARWEGLLRRVKADGFDGIEVCHGPTAASAFPFTRDLGKFQQLMRDVGLVLVVLVPTVWAGHPGNTAEKEQGLPARPGNDVAHHVASFKRLCEEAAAWGPVLINVHSGKDSFTLDEALDYFTQVAAIEATLPCPVSHETHRGRILHSPFVYRDLMPRLPASLKVTADLSHWPPWPSAAPAGPRTRSSGRLCWRTSRRARCTCTPASAGAPARRCPTRSPPSTRATSRRTWSGGRRWWRVCARGACR